MAIFIMSKSEILDHSWLLSSLISNLSQSPIETTSRSPLQSPVLPIPPATAVVMASSFSPWTTVASSRSGVRTGPHSRRWVVGQQAKLHLYLQPLLVICITAWALPSVMSLTALDSHRSTNPTMNCTYKGSRLCVPSENLMPDDLMWSWGRDHNKSIACRLIKKLHLGADFIVAREVNFLSCTVAPWCQALS